MDSRPWWCHLHTLLGKELAFSKKKKITLVKLHTENYLMIKFMILFLLHCDSYLEYLNGLAPTQCPRSSGSFLLLFQFIHVCEQKQNKKKNCNSIHASVKYSENLQCKCSKNVVLLSTGLHATVLFIWETVCWSNHSTYSTVERRTPHSALQ